MAVTLSPFGPKPQFVDASGSPDLSFKLFFYAAGSNTKQDTYTDSTGVTTNANPIILNSLGQPTSEIWFTVGQLYKVVLAPSTDTDPPTSPVWSIDNIQGMGTVTTTTALDEWVLYAQSPTFITATSFSVPGNQTATFQVGRRVKTVNTGGTVVYSTIVTSVFGAVTTITVRNDSGTLDAGLSAVSYGLISAQNSSLPFGPAFSAYQGGAAQVFTANVYNKITINTEEWDDGSNFDTSTSTFTAPYACRMRFVGGIIAVAATTLTAALYKNGSVAKYGNGGLTNFTGVQVSATLELAAGDTVTLQGFSTSTATMTTGTAGCYFQGWLERRLT
jgi:hypothetical protein